MKRQEKEIVYAYLTRNQFFRVIVRIYPSPRTRNFVKIIRRDTLEVYESFFSESIDKEILTTQANEFINLLEKPIDWKLPHRYCIAFYSRLIEEDDIFRDSLREDKIDSRRVWFYMMKRLLKETILIKKLNQLSYTEKRQLLIIKDWEFKASSNLRVGYGIWGRNYLYKRLYNKKGLEENYQMYCQKTKEYMDEFDDND